MSALRLQQTVKMARSAHAYVRGSTVKFYEWLEQQKRGTLPEGPPVWICGDCHAGNRLSRALQKTCHASAG
jgi:uncharacterized protein (DUF2252 family)